MILLRISALWLCLALPAWADMITARTHFENRAFEAARETLEPLARAGNAEAELMLGDLYGLGLLEPSPERAVVFWQRAALKGHPLAQLRLARAYRDGRGAQADPLRAALWARLAVIGGAPLATDMAAATYAALDAEKRREMEHLLADLKPYLYPLAD